MVTHSSILAWRIPWTEEPGGLQSIVWKSWTGLKQLSTWVPGDPVAKTPSSQWVVGVGSGWGLIPGEGIRPHMPQLRVHKVQLKIPHAETKTQSSQVK